MGRDGEDHGGVIKSSDEMKGSSMETQAQNLVVDLWILLKVLEIKNHPPTWLFFGATCIIIFCRFFFICFLSCFLSPSSHSACNKRGVCLFRIGLMTEGFPDYLYPIVDLQRWRYVAD